jgi:chromosome segregation ATPase
MRSLINITPQHPSYLTDINDIKGSIHIVDNIVERDNISNQHRKTGMIVTVVNDTPSYKQYQLKEGINNTNWVEYTTDSDLSELEEEVVDLGEQISDLEDTVDNLDHSVLHDKNGDNNFLHLTQTERNKFLGYETTINNLISRIGELESNPPTPPTPESPFIDDDVKDAIMDEVNNILDELEDLGVEDLEDLKITDDDFEDPEIIKDKLNDIVDKLEELEEENNITDGEEIIFTDDDTKQDIID